MTLVQCQKRSLADPEPVLPVLLMPRRHVQPEGAAYSTPAITSVTKLAKLNASARAVMISR